MSATDQRLIRDDIDAFTVRALESVFNFDLSDGTSVQSIATDDLIRIAQWIAHNAS